jgi:hypothetical protein
VAALLRDELDAFQRHRYDVVRRAGAEPSSLEDFVRFDHRPCGHEGDFTEDARCWCGASLISTRRRWWLVQMRVRTRNLLVGLIVGYLVAVAVFMLGGPRWLAPLLIAAAGLVGYLLPEDRYAP